MAEFLLMAVLVVLVFAVLFGPEKFIAIEV